MFERILAVSEFSPVAFYAFKCLKSLQKLGAKQCLLVQCLNPREISPRTASVFTSVFAEILEKQKSILTEQGFEVETRTVSGLVNNEINRIAAEENLSLIVAGVLGHSMVSELFSGGAAQEVMHQALKPVLLIKTPDNPEAVSGMVTECDITRHVLFPTDFSDNAERAFQYIKKMVEGGIRKVTVVHVQDKALVDRYMTNLLEEFSENDWDRLEDMKRELRSIQKDVEVDIQRLYGSPTAEILRLIREQGIPLVVMGSQGRGFIEEIYVGSVSHNIVRHSAASVLLIPAKR